MKRDRPGITARFGTQAAHFIAAGPPPARPASIPESLRRAVQHHQAGRLAEAEGCYREILAIDENHFDGLHLLGVLAQQSGHSELAERLIGKAIDLYDRTHARSEKAASGSVTSRGKHAIGRRHLAEAHSNLSIVLMSLDRQVEALRAIQRSIQLAETENTKLLFVNCLDSLNFVPEDLDLRDNLARALSESWGRPIYLSRFAANVIKRDGKTAARIRRLAAADSARQPRQDTIDTTELAEICGDRLLRTLLETTVIFDIDVERYLTAIRAAMLAAASGTEPRECGKDILRFFCALARQCFINEFVFACSHQEQELAQRLRGLVAGALNSGAPIPELWLVALAAYYPLASLPAANLLAQRHWSDAAAQLVTLQVREVEQERQLLPSVPRLTSIGQGTSHAVRQQYEESPYPRWIKTSPVGPSATVAARLREQFPHIDPRILETPEAAEILIAGCGTGQHSIETARQFKQARLLAIDLSLTSLCYAVRKTRELGLRNIEYAQADILQLGTLDRTFDVIEASGVLHHLAEPLAGWQVLLSILRPGGFMRLGLYSKLARRDLAPVRAFIAQRGYGSSPQEIRLSRQELTSFEQNAALAKVAEWADFFSTSTCRDLLFHVQEHLLTLPEISAFLQQNQLQFVGFILPRATQERFKQRFPDNVAMTNLGNWHIFETENPTTFTGMYEFWIRKPT